MKYARWALPVLWAGTLSVLIVAILTPFGAATTPDSLSYLDIASNIATGDGVKASDFSLSASTTRGLIEQRAWPPLYPAALSLFTQHKTDVNAAARLSMLLLAISMVLVFLLLAKSTELGIALLLMSIFGMTIPILTIYTFAWSETLFVPLMLLAAWSASRYAMLSQGRQGQRLPTLLILLVALSMLAYTRYIGIVFSLLLPLTFLMSRRDSIDRGLLTATSLFYCLIVGHLLYTNLVMTGHLSGIQRPPSNEGILEVLESLQHVLMVLVPDNLTMLGAALVVASLLAWLRYQREPSSAVNHQARTIMIMLATSGIVYLGALITLRSQYRFDNIDVRLFTPAFVAFFCVFALMPWAIAARRKAAIMQLLAGLLVVIPAAQGYVRLEAAPENWHERHNPGHKHNIQGIYNNFTRDTVNDSRRQLFTELMTPGGVLVTNRPIVWEFISGFRSMQKPAIYDAKTLQIFDTLPHGSLLIMKRHELSKFQSAINTTFIHIDLGQHIAIPLPVKLVR